MTIDRKKIVAGNWKMNLTLAEGEELVRTLLATISGKNIVAEIWIAPSFIHLHSLQQLTKGSAITLVAQNCAAQAWGAFTGEVSAFMLASMGISQVIIGHSERRQYYGESDDIIKSKIDTALEAKLRPVFCCGESKEARLSEQHEQYIFYQLKDNLFHLNEAQFSKITIAYEPIWAIGTGMTATPAQAEQIHAFIRKEIAHRYSAATAEGTTILYGGSVNAANANELFSQPNIDGGLVGGASLKPQDFFTIINSI